MRGGWEARLWGVTVGGQDGGEDGLGFVVGEGGSGEEGLQEGAVAVVILGVAIF